MKKPLSASTKKKKKSECGQIEWKTPIIPTLSECKWVANTLCKRNRRLFEIATTSTLRAQVTQALIITWIGLKGGRL